MQITEDLRESWGWQSVTIDSRTLRSALGHFATGVTVVTYECEGERYGVTVNAFTAVSLEPPLILVSLDRRSRASEKLLGRPFVVNILSAEQCELALNFAGRPQPDLQVGWDEDANVSCPRFANSSAYFACTPWHSYDGGDHVLVLGEVQDLDLSGGEPLLFYGGRFRSVGGFPDAVVEPTFVPDPGWFGETHHFLYPRDYAERMRANRSVDR
jgi:flavin reductase (DIM6/NTAB) family NADH-FMN oxidoreductase RutF